jgi:LuxR family quorum sensing-dependent transcriptional regulator
MPYSKAFAFVERLDRLPSADEVMDAMLCVLGPFGFESFAFFAMPRPGLRLEDVRFACRMPRKLREIVHKEQYILISPAARHCRRTVHPFKWNTAPYDREREPRAAAFVDVMTEFELANGIAVPIPSPTGCEGMAWLAGQRQDLTACNMPLIHFVALYAFDRIRRLANRMPFAKPNLTPREREVLTWVAMGKSAWEIGEILGVAKRTADEHVRQAMQKLGASNRTQAVAIACRDCLIEP